MWRAGPSESAKTVARKPSGKVTVSGEAVWLMAAVESPVVSAGARVRPESPQAGEAKASKDRAARAMVRVGFVMQKKYTRAGLLVRGRRIRRRRQPPWGPARRRT